MKKSKEEKLKKAVLEKNKYDIFPKYVKIQVDK